MFSSRYELPLLRLAVRLGGLFFLFLLLRYLADEAGWRFFIAPFGGLTLFALIGSLLCLLLGLFFLVFATPPPDNELSLPAQPDEEKQPRLPPWISQQTDGPPEDEPSPTSATAEREESPEESDLPMAPPVLLSGRASERTEKKPTKKSPYQPGDAHFTRAGCLIGLAVAVSGLVVALLELKILGALLLLTGTGVTMIDHFRQQLKLDRKTDAAFQEKSELLAEMAESAGLTYVERPDPEWVHGWASLPLLHHLRSQYVAQLLEGSMDGHRILVFDLQCSNNEIEGLEDHQTVVLVPDQPDLPEFRLSPQQGMMGALLSSGPRVNLKEAHFPDDPDFSNAYSLKGPEAEPLFTEAVRSHLLRAPKICVECNGAALLVYRLNVIDGPEKYSRRIDYALELAELLQEAVAGLD